MQPPPPPSCTVTGAGGAAAAGGGDGDDEDPLPFDGVVTTIIPPEYLRWLFDDDDGFLHRRAPPPPTTAAADIAAVVTPPPEPDLLQLARQLDGGEHGHGAAEAIMAGEGGAGGGGDGDGDLFGDIVIPPDDVMDLELLLDDDDDDEEEDDDGEEEDDDDDGGLSMTYRGHTHVFESVPPDKVETVLRLLNGYELALDPQTVKPKLTHLVHPIVVPRNFDRAPAMLPYRKKRKSTTKDDHSVRRDMALWMARSRGIFVPPSDKSSDELQSCTNCGESNEVTPTMRRSSNGDKNSPALGQSNHEGGSWLEPTQNTNHQLQDASGAGDDNDHSEETHQADTDTEDTAEIEDPSVDAEMVQGDMQGVQAEAFVGAEIVTEGIQGELAQATVDAEMVIVDLQAEENVDAEMVMQAVQRNQVNAMMDDDQRNPVAGLPSVVPEFNQDQGDMLHLSLCHNRDGPIVSHDPPGDVHERNQLNLNQLPVEQLTTPVDLQLSCECQPNKKEMGRVREEMEGDGYIGDSSHENQAEIMLFLGNSIFGRNSRQITVQGVPRAQGGGPALQLLFAQNDINQVFGSATFQDIQDSGPADPQGEHALDLARNAASQEIQADQSLDLAQNDEHSTQHRVVTRNDDLCPNMNVSFQGQDEVVIPGDNFLSNSNFHIGMSLTRMDDDDLAWSQAANVEAAKIFTKFFSESLDGEQEGGVGSSKKMPQEKSVLKRATMYVESEERKKRLYPVARARIVQIEPASPSQPIENEEDAEPTAAEMTEKDPAKNQEE